MGFQQWLNTIFWVEVQAGTCKHGRKPSGRRAFGSPAFHLAVVIFLCYLPLMSGGAMAVCVQLDFSLGSPFATSMARVFIQIIVVILIVICFLERNKSFHVCRHLETECSSFYQTILGASKQMMSPCLYICSHVTTAVPLCGWGHAKYGLIKIPYVCYL